MMKYRPEIDGLRAVAVLPVLLFHAKFSGFSGGYIGVDIFFVISGYLITSVILSDLEEQRFTFVRFYERRARRILPALFLVILACIPFAVMWMHAHDLLDFAQSVGAVVLFASNVLFFKEKHYFGRDNELKPLIHTWSLSIEEQFYVIFPILLLLIWRFNKDRLGTFMMVGFIVSVAYADYSSRFHQSATFYFLHTRAWELLAGAMLARSEMGGYRLPRLPRHQDLLVLLGLAMIGVSVGLFDDTTRHPSFYTLLPVAGTMLIIQFGRTSRLAQLLLANKIAIGIGLVSYSLYLWHQPLFAFARIYASDEVLPYEYGILIAASFVLAVLSWRYVERPFRRRQTVPAKMLWASAVTCAGLLFASGVYGHLTRGVPQRFGPDAQKIFEAMNSNADLLMKRDGRQCFERDPDDACRIGASGVEVTWALVGDSHAAALSISLDRSLRDVGVAGVQYTKGGCLYVPGFDRINWRYCSDWIAAVHEKLKDPQLRTVVLTGRYVLQLEGNRFDNGEGGLELGPPAGYERWGQPSKTETLRKEDFATGVREAIEGLLAQGKHVVLVYPIPEVGWNVPDRLFKAYLRGINAEITTSWSNFRRRSERIVAAFDSIGENGNLTRVYPGEIFCDSFVPGRCTTGDGDKVFYFDDDHLSIQGADLVVQRIMRAAQ